MAIRVRPLSESDAGALLPIDDGYAVSHGVEGVANAAALRFFERSGHSFVAELVDSGGAPRAVGFLLAQAVWSGNRPVVHLMRVAAEMQAGAEVAGALVRALVKSAYDAGVYDLLARVPGGDADLERQLQAEEFQPDTQRSFVRVLGSRGVAAKAGAVVDREEPSDG